ncbi:hypothetical protein LAZ67_7000220 [Cordylochernes scorpioides]|uniref:Uncharacterized protein n=1 Tax=Cordylochernes scorpioides TaxID=51811 RepID=A0ABY6KLG4_9ARAC|nr:hypothetical protein LAZ67_7000220 [Cordylochernes scorpioides]
MPAQKSSSTWGEAAQQADNVLLQSTKLLHATKVVKQVEIPQSREDKRMITDRNIMAMGLREDLEFEHVKMENNNASSLNKFDKHLKIKILQCDASRESMGAALSQDGRPLAFNDKLIIRIIKAKISYEELAIFWEETSNDHALNKIIKYVMEGWPQDFTATDTETRTSAIVVPKTQWAYILDLLHQGLSVMCNLARETLFGPGISDPVVLNPNIDLPKYDGTEDPRPWIESLEEIGFLYHWADYIISRYAAMNMIGSAKTWLNLHKISFTSWENFKSRLIEDFASAANKE